MNQQGTSGRWTRLVLATAVTATFGVAATLADPAPDVAQAASVVPETSFQIDGNRAGPDDFAAPYGPGLTPGGFPTTGLYHNVRTFDENQTTGCAIDNDPSTAKGGTNIGDGPVWPVGGPDPNGKTDLDFVELAAEKVNVSGEIFDILYVGYRKCGGQGTWQTALYLDDGDGITPTGGDANGDYLFIFDFNPSSGLVTFFQHRRVAGAWQLQPSDTTFIEGAAAGDFGEVALNLTELVLDDAAGNAVCRSLVISGPAASITGGSLTSQVKDLLGFSPLRIDNCGQVTVEKTSPSLPASTELFGYQFGQGPNVSHDASLSASGIVAPATTDEPDADRNEVSATISVGQTHVWSNVIQGPDYAITETLPVPPAGWVIESIVCEAADIFVAGYPVQTFTIYENGAYTGATFPVPPATIGNTALSQASCVLTNAVAGIVVEKQTVPDGATVGFPFNVAGGGTSDDTTLADGESEFFAFAPGTSVTITEGAVAASPAWNATDITCRNEDGSTALAVVDLGARTATVTTGAIGNTITCTFTNTQDTELTLVKEVVNDNGGDASATDWTLSADGPVVLSGAGGASGVVPAGAYDLSESGGPAGYTASSWSCDGGALVGAALTLAEGDDVTCTITNDDDAPSLTLVKEVVNDNGGTAVSTDWTLSAAGPTPISGAGGASSDATFDVGTYTLSESGGPAGYTAGAWSCVGGAQLGATITVDLGESATCTIVNDDDAPSLTLIKEVVNDNGGTAVPGDWTLTATGYDAASPDAGTYTLSESGPSGYTLVSLTCDNAVGQVTEVTLALGEDVTCTFVNDDNGPGLTLVKEVVNDNGGTAPPTAWTLTADGPTPIGGLGGATSGADFEAGTYTLSESGPGGYTASDWVCVGGSQAGDQITLGLGESATCTITNDDDAPSLTLVKEVVNDNGGIAVGTDFVLSATGPTSISGPGGATSDTGFAAGTYDLSETGPAGYTAGDWDCVGGSQAGAQITLGLGESATCTIVNDDDAPSLTLVKEVVNDNGGTAAPGDWTLTAAGYDPISPDAGTYPLSEAGPGGYTLVSLTCDNAVGEVTDVTLTLGEDVTCTFVNDDDAPSLTIDKVVVNDNGGTAVDTDFVLSATGPTSISGAGGASSGAGFSAGTYNLSEAGPGGYSASAWVCTGDGVQVGAQITLELGESATCTITNDDDAPSLELVKVVTNDNGGTAVAADFVLVADGPTPISGPGGVVSDATFDAGTYALSETGPAGYTASEWVCVGGVQDGAQVSLGLGESATCTITNDDDVPSLTLVKIVSNDDGGPAESADFTVSADGPTPISGAGGATSGADFEAGTYTLSETDVAGYQLVSLTCDNDEGDVSSVTVGLGEDVTCTFVNDDRPVDLELTKTDDGFEAIAGGGPIPYTITVQNVGSRDADPDEPITVTDELPPFLSWNTFPASCSADGQVLTCDIDPAAMTAGGPAVTIDALVDVSPDAPSGDYENRAWVDLEDDPVCEGEECVPPPCAAAASNNNLDCEETPVDRFATITIVKTDDVADGVAVEPGDTYSYDLVVTNNGPSSILPGLVVDDILPVQVDLVATVGGAGWTCNSVDPIECTYGPGIAPGASTTSITVTVEVVPTATGETIDNVAFATGAVDRDCPELPGGFAESHVSLACNQVMDDDDESTPLQSNADLAIVKTASVAQVGAGGAFTYTLDVTNNGPATAVDVVVGDIVPNSVTVTGVSSTFFDCARSGNSLACTRPSMAVGAIGTITIDVNVPSTAPGGTVVNIGTVEATTPDPDLSNNSDDASVVIVAIAPPTTALPPVTLPRTGSDATGGLVTAALAFLVIGAGAVLATRRRPEPIDD